MSRKQRRLKNYLINPRVQFRFFTPYLVQLVMVATLIEGILYYNSRILREAIPQVGPESTLLISEMFMKLAVASAVALVFIAVVGFAILLVQSHRLLGPIVPITRFIRGLANGELEQDLILRKNDDLKQVADELNNLAQVLRKR
jgi:methyl-accepting chemotaxis protein